MGGPDGSSGSGIQNPSRDGKAKKEEAPYAHQARRTAFGSVGQAIAGGLKLRHDNGSQFISRAFQAELRFLGMDSSVPALTVWLLIGRQHRPFGGEITTVQWKFGLFG